MVCQAIGGSLPLTVVGIALCPVPIIAAGQKLTGLVAEKVAGQGAVDRLDALRTAVKAVQP
jgi:hypothetical protein